MNDEFHDEFAFYETNRREPALAGGQHWSSLANGAGWFDSLRHLWQWDELAAEIGQESQSQVVLAGLVGAGKSLLFNRLRGWVVSGASEADTEMAMFQLQDDLALESLGLFILADLPSVKGAMFYNLAGADLLMSLGDPALVVYLLDGEDGVRPDDFRWVSALRAGGRPLIVALNKMDLIADSDALAADASQKLGMPVIPLSAETGLNVEDGLLPAMLDAVPRLAVPLGREIMGLRRVAARRVIRQAAIFSGLMAVQPVPMLDIPLQVVVQVGVVMRVGAAYGYTPTGGMNREVMGTVVSTLGLRYLVLALVKFIPFIGSLVSGVLCALMTYLLGEAAIRYYEAGATVPLRDFLRLATVRNWWARRWETRRWRGERRQEARHKRRRSRWVCAKPACAGDVVEESEEIPFIDMSDERAAGGMTVAVAAQAIANETVEDDL